MDHPKLPKNNKFLSFIFLDSRLSCRMSLQKKHLPKAQPDAIHNEYMVLLNRHTSCSNVIKISAPYKLTILSPSIHFIYA